MKKASANNREAKRGIKSNTHNVLGTVFLGRRLSTRMGRNSGVILKESGRSHHEEEKQEEGKKARLSSLRNQEREDRTREKRRLFCERRLTLPLINENREYKGGNN